MPIYEYLCAKCGEFEVTQRITDDPLKRCPTCRSKVRKLISNSSFQLKGSGWYVTDYARKDGAASKETAETKGESANAAGSDAGEKSTAEGKKEGQKEAKKAEKKEGGAKAA